MSALPRQKAHLQSQTKFADLVQISPEDFSKHSIVAIEDNINAKYANKVGVFACLSRSSAAV